MKRVQDLTLWNIFYVSWFIFELIIIDTDGAIFVASDGSERGKLWYIYVRT